MAETSALPSSHQMKQASLSSTVHGGGNGERSCVGVDRLREDAIILAAGLHSASASVTS